MPKTFPFRCLLSVALAAAWSSLAFPQISNTRSLLSVTAASNAAVKLGIDVLAEKRFDLVAGKRIGLLTHPAGVNRHGASTIDVLRLARGTTLTTLFGPEHGIYGDEAASVPVLDKTDARTGLPVYSLYGKYRKPTPEMLANIDALVIDLQDVGVRSYTFISCMRLAIEACFENNVEVIVLDRPNPLGGLKVDGPPLDPSLRSYVGDFPVPYVHGLTIGELARMSVSQTGILEVTPQQMAQGKLTVVTMDGWRRYMSWPQTGLAWVPTSPNIPTFEAAVGYPMTGLGAQLGGFEHGIGTEYPFRILTFKGVGLDQLENALRARPIGGVDYERKPFSNGQTGLYVKVTDWKAWRPTELSFYMMQIAALFAETNPFAAASESQAQLFNKHVGSLRWWQEISRRGASANVAGFIGDWERQARQFQLQSRRYWLYD